MLRFAGEGSGFSSPIALPKNFDKPYGSILPQGQSIYPGAAGGTTRYSYSVRLVFHRIEFCNLVSVVLCNPHTALIIDGDPVGQRYGIAICIVRLGSPKSV